MPDGFIRKSFPENNQTNVLGLPLISCSTEPMTGFFRNGCCESDVTDQGLHTVCAKMTKDFLEFSSSVGNDLSTPQPDYNFKGLVPGDYWCLCALRWVEAFDVGKAPLVKLSATNILTLKVCNLDDLLKYAVDKPINDNS